ncbi:MAG: 2-alkenal reductase [Ignavibacteria bacterium]|nr:MAG: 2-alkenal reductase [Ignavibacteria bacterium]
MKYTRSILNVSLLAVLIFAQTGLQACQSENRPEGRGAKIVSRTETGGDDIAESRRNAITRAVEHVSPAVVGINVTEIRERRMHPFWRMYFGEQYTPVQSVGSGFVISEDGYIVTNDHVAGRADRIVVTMTDGSKHPAQLIGTDPVTDIALIKIEAEHPLPWIEFGNSDDVIVGEWSIAFGNPFGFFSASAKPTVTVGVISATQINLERREEKIYRKMLQTDAAINQGNSGGPLVNSEGEVIGVNTVIYTPNEGSIGLGFAVPVNRVREIIRILMEEGTVDRNFIPGFRVQAVNEAIAQAYSLEKTEGVIVTQITDRGGVAAKSGLQVADIILSANDEPVFAINVLENQIRYSIKGETLLLRVLRDNSIRDIELNLE